MLGLADGQLVAGLISDALGRRRRLSPAWPPTGWPRCCAPSLRPSGCCSPPASSRAGRRGRDRHRARDRARPARRGRAPGMFAMLMLVGGLAPILARLVGGELLHVTDWRGIFVVLAGIGAGCWSRPGDPARELAPAAAGAADSWRRCTSSAAAWATGRPWATPLGRADLRRDGDLHLGLAVRAPGDPRRLAAAVQRDLRLQRHRDHGREPVSRALVALRPAREARGRRVDRAAGGLGVSSPWWPGSARRPAPQPLRDGLERRRGAAQRGRARPGRPPPTAGSASRPARPDQFATGALAAPLAGVALADRPADGVVMATLPLAGLACLRVLAAPSAPRPVPLDAKVFGGGCGQGQKKRKSAHSAVGRGWARTSPESRITGPGLRPTCTSAHSAPVVRAAGRPARAPHSPSPAGGADATGARAAPAGVASLPDLQTIIPRLVFHRRRAPPARVPLHATRLQCRSRAAGDPAGVQRRLRQLPGPSTSPRTTRPNQLVPGLQRARADAFVFHAAHGHFHFPLAAFGLYAVAADGGIGAPVAVSPKNGFCIDDSYIYDRTVVHAGAFVAPRAAALTRRRCGG